VSKFCNGKQKASTTNHFSTHTQQRNGNTNRLPDVLQFILNLIKLHDNPVAAAAYCVH
jgi:hypothetical protein